MGDTYTDGVIQTGSRILHIGTTWSSENWREYVATAFNLTRPSKATEQMDQNDKPAKQKLTAGWVTGTATLQFPSAEEWTVPLFGEFAITGLNPDNKDECEVFVISEVGRAETQGGERMQNISFRKVITPIGI